MSFYRDATLLTILNALSDRLLFVSKGRISKSEISYFDQIARAAVIYGKGLELTTTEDVKLYNKYCAEEEKGVQKGSTLFTQPSALKWGAKKQLAFVVQEFESAVPRKMKPIGLDGVEDIKDKDWDAFVKIGTELDLCEYLAKFLQPWWYHGTGFDGADENNQVALRKEMGPESGTSEDKCSYSTSENKESDSSDHYYCEDSTESLRRKRHVKYLEPGEDENRAYIAYSDLMNYYLEYREACKLQGYDSNFSFWYGSERVEYTRQPLMRTPAVISRAQCHILCQTYRLFYQKTQRESNGTKTYFGENPLRSIVAISSLEDHDVMPSALMDYENKEFRHYPMVSWNSEFLLDMKERVAPLFSNDRSKERLDFRCKYLLHPLDPIKILQFVSKQVAESTHLLDAVCPRIEGPPSFSMIRHGYRKEIGILAQKKFRTDANEITMISSLLDASRLVHSESESIDQKFPVLFHASNLLFLQNYQAATFKTFLLSLEDLTRREESLLSEESRREKENLSSSMLATMDEIIQNYGNRIVTAQADLKKVGLSNFEKWLERKLPSPFTPTPALDL